MFFNCTIFASWCVILGVHVWILVSWSVSVGWLVVPPSLILSIIAACWVWTRFRIKRLCTLSCYKLTSGPTRFTPRHTLAVIGREALQPWRKIFSLKKIFLLTKVKKNILIDIKKWFIIYWLILLFRFHSYSVVVSHLYSQHVHYLIIELLTDFLHYTLSSFWANGDNDDDLCISQ